MRLALVVFLTAAIPVPQSRGLPSEAPVFGSEGGSRAADDISIVTAERGRITASSLRIYSAPDALMLEYRDFGGTQKIRCDEVVEIRLADAAPPAPRDVTDVEVELTSGDRIRGVLRKGEKYAVRLQTDVFGDISFKYEQIRAVVSRRNVDLAPERPARLSEDMITTTTGERGGGTLEDASPAGVVYDSSIRGVLVTVPLDKFAAAYLAPMPGAPKAEAPKTLYAILEARDGSSVRGEISKLEEGLLVFKDLYGNERKVDVARLASVHFRNGRVVYLSDLEPAAKDEDANYIRDVKPLPSNLDIPFQRDLSAAKTPIKLRKKAYRKGIGVHAYSALEWDVADGGYTRFHATIGLDDHAEGRGHVVFQVFVDGAKRYERALGGEDPPVDVSVPLTGANRLRLVVDFGERANMSDYADWAGARLIR